MSNPIYKISMLGPTRVGKTSLISTISNMVGTKLLTGTPISFETEDLATEKKLAMHDKELRGSINAGSIGGESFNAGALAGTQSPFKFKFSLKSMNDENMLNFEILDFPGGWLDPTSRPEGASQQWKDCEKWITESAVIIIPVEATVIMSAASPKELRAIEDNIQSEAIAKIVRQWAKNRAYNYPGEPSVVIFAPTKCESYFIDNVRTTGKNQSSELYEKVNKYYDCVIRAIQDEFTSGTNVSILYTAVDTIGCVDLRRGDWKVDNEDNDQTLRFMGTYSVIPSKNGIQPKGADDIFITICKTIVQAYKIAEEKRLEKFSEKYQSSHSEAEEARRIAEEDEGLLGNFWSWINGSKEDKRNEAKNKESIASEDNKEKLSQEKKLQTISEIIKEISERTLSNRTKIIQ